MYQDELEGLDFSVISLGGSTVSLLPRKQAENSLEDEDVVRFIRAYLRRTLPYWMSLLHIVTFPYVVCDGIGHGHEGNARPVLQ